MSPRQRGCPLDDRPGPGIAVVAVHASARSCGAESERSAEVSQVDTAPDRGTGPTAPEIAPAGRVIWLQVREWQLTGEIAPKPRFHADRQEIDRTGAVLSAFFAPSGTLRPCIFTPQAGPAQRRGATKYTGGPCRKFIFPYQSKSSPEKVFESAHTPFAGIQLAVNNLSFAVRTDRGRRRLPL